MEKTWRWFGPNDIISLETLRQIGVEGIVTSLHHIPNGEIWPTEEIERMKQLIESHGLRWSVVESLPVCEEIKYAGPDRDRLIQNYIESLRNLGKSGVWTICYNFMPVLDWARTDLEYLNPDGTRSLYFNRAEFAYFDIYLLKRAGAAGEWDEETLRRVEELKSVMTPSDDARLIENIIIKTQGFVNGNITGKEDDPLEKFRQILSLYNGIDRDTLRDNLKYFLEAIMPVCREYDIRMCIHPDDPPMQILGLPRIVSCADDIEWMLNAVPDPHNGITFCAGSLSAGSHNDVPAMARRFADRTWFIHLRSCEILPNGDFREASHLGGRADIISLVRTFETINPGLPMRVDHGRLMLDDAGKGYNAGYSFHGRMLALGQVDGVMATVSRYMSNKL
ncbi:MAG: mannonate dehydratase [Muribaculaceae bacterium]|nr:mannonate dehydratase [Muribaculaceae bacterium]